MLDFAVNLGAVESIVDELPWAVGVVIAIAIIGVGLTVVSNRNQKRERL